MKKKSISVIIPAYNSEDSIVECVESVINQTKFELIKEIIIINDGSTDFTEIILEKLNTKYDLIKIISQKNQGVSKSRNKGIKISTGEWIAFLDADDKWIETKLEKQSIIIDNYNPLMIAGNVKKELQKVGINNTERVVKVNPIDMLIRSFPQTSTVLIKKKVFDNLLFNEDQSYSEDINLFTKICYKFNYYHLNEQVVIYGNNKNQFGKHKGLSSNIKAMNKGARRNLKEYKSMGIINKKLYIFFSIFNELKYLRRIIKMIYARIDCFFI